MARKASTGFTLVELLIVIVIISMLAALILPALTRALCLGRQGAAKKLIERIAISTHNYKKDLGNFPPNGSGSSTLATALKTIGKGKESYLEFQPDELDGAGNIVSPVHPGIDILYYKNHRINFPANQSDASAHNKQSFDLWCKNCNNVVDGINNWGGG